MLSLWSICYSSTYFTTFPKGVFYMHENCLWMVVVPYLSSLFLVFMFVIIVLVFRLWWVIGFGVCLCCYCKFGLVRYTQKLYRTTNQSKNPQNPHKNPHEKHTPKCHQIPYLPSLEQKETWQQTNTCSPTIRWKQLCTTPKPTSHRRHNTQYCISAPEINIGLTGSHSHRYK